MGRARLDSILAVRCSFGGGGIGGGWKRDEVERGFGGRRELIEEIGWRSGGQLDETEFRRMSAREKCYQPTKQIITLCK